MNSYLKMNFILKLTFFILINFCIIFQISFFKNLMLIRFQRIEANYLYVSQTNFIKKISHMNCFYISSWYETLWFKKASDNPKK
jgi:hypothetical protein